MTCALNVDTDEVRRSAETMMLAVEYYAQSAQVHSVEGLRALPGRGSAPVREALECAKRCAQKAILASDAMAALGRSTAVKLATTAARMDEAEQACAIGF